jgi:hypothetical protein
MQHDAVLTSNEILPVGVNLWAWSADVVEIIIVELSIDGAVIVGVKRVGEPNFLELQEVLWQF